MNPAKSKGQFSWRRTVWVLVVILATIVGMISLVLYFNPMSSIHRQSHRFFSNVEQNINPENLRIWASKVASEHAFGSKPKASELPNELSKLSEGSPSICICATNAQSDQPYVMLIYGGGNYHWGIDIGPTNFVRPDNPSFTTVKWAAGIYFRHEGADK